MPTKSPTTKAAKKPKVSKPKKTAAVRHKAVGTSHKKIQEAANLALKTPAETSAAKHQGKSNYIFATGRRKTSIANVRLFTGKAGNLVNKQSVNKYFNYPYYLEESNRPFEVTGLYDNYHFTSQVSGGGQHSQAQALKHGLATALAKTSLEVRKVLKKNGLLTRDDRKKERKKPGLKRARRSPQWAKR